MSGSRLDPTTCYSLLDFACTQCDFVPPEDEYFVANIQQLLTEQIHVHVMGVALLFLCSDHKLSKNQS